MTSRGMIHVFGKTYRIVERADFHEIVRVLDDLAVGAFRHRPSVEILYSTVDQEHLRDVVREALRAARVSERGRNNRWSLGKSLRRVFWRIIMDELLSPLTDWARALLDKVRSRMAWRSPQLQKSNSS